MGKLPKQTKRRYLIKRFRELHFTGPHQGVKGRQGDHPEFMERDGRVVKLPNPHHADIGEGLLKTLLMQAGVSIEEWLGERAKAKSGEEEEPASGSE